MVWKSSIDSAPEFTCGLAVSVLSGFSGESSSHEFLNLKEISKLGDAAMARHCLREVLKLLKKGEEPFHFNDCYGLIAL